MLVSFIVTVFNKEHIILETLECLVNQKLPIDTSIEIICVDDKSTDKSIELIKQFSTNYPNVFLVENIANKGPSFSINRAANYAHGDYFIPIDADDLIPNNHLATLLNIALREKADFVIGKSIRTNSFPELITIEPNFQQYKGTKSLDFIVKKKLCHMGFLVSSSLWKSASGAFEKVFIQDQSLPMRLAHKASCMVFINHHIYYLSPRTEENLSSNTNQQHHDRFFSALDMLENKDLSNDSIFGLKGKVISSIWKCYRDRFKWRALFSQPFFIYVSNKVFKTTYNDNLQKKWECFFKNLENVRRM